MQSSIQKLLSLFIFLSASNGIYGQADSTKRDSLETKSTILPVLYFLPETSLGFGALGILSLKNKTHYEVTRPSQIIFGAAYTLRKQLLIYCPFEFYGNSNKWRIKGELGYYRYFYNYFGLGPESRREEKEIYKVNFPRLDINYIRRISNKVYLGAGVNADHYDILETEKDGLLERERPEGYEGGNKVNIYATMLYDDRDNPYSTQSGSFLELKVQRSLSPFLSDFDYTLVGIDVRHFSTTENTITFASRIRLLHATEGTPFFDLPYLSSPNLGRGFNDRRYINRTLFSVQQEVRIPIYKRFSGVGFGGIYLLPELPEIHSSSDMKYNFGLGLRYLLDPINRTVIRLDVGKGIGDAVNFYLTVNEAF